LGESHRPRVLPAAESRDRRCPAGPSRRVDPTRRLHGRRLRLGGAEMTATMPERRSAMPGPSDGSRRAAKMVIPAAGFGTRFLPATKAVPKELLPVVDKPALQYIVEEAAA